LVSYRSQKADTFFQGTREAQGVPPVRRDQQILDLAFTHAFNKQGNVTLSVPVVDLNFGLGLLPGGAIDDMNAKGIGDVSLVVRGWLADCDLHPHSNISLGFGVKIPIGSSDKRDTYVNGAGANPRVKAVDISSQPGDSGFGFVFDAQGFRRVGKTMLFASAVYLMNPRNTNSTLSLPSGLMGSQNVPANIRVNSVPDAFLVRGGGAVALSRRLSFNLAGRVEGTPATDIASFPDHVLLISYSYRFGK
jgi:hypothetical protein